MDGWDEDKLDDVREVLEDITQAEYEIRMCRRGVYSGATTYTDLADYLAELGRRLTGAAEYLGEQDYDDDEEDE